MCLALGRGGADTLAAPPSTSYDNRRQKSLEQDRQPVDPASWFRSMYLIVWVWHLLYVSFRHEALQTVTRSGSQTRGGGPGRAVGSPVSTRFLLKAGCPRQCPLQSPRFPKLGFRLFCPVPASG